MGLKEVDAVPIAPAVPRNTQSPDLKAEFQIAVEKMGDFLRATLKTLPHDLPVQFLGETAGYADGVALKGAFMITLLSREKRYRGYIETNEVMELRQLAVGHLANSKMQDLRRIADVDGPPKRADMLKLSADETVKCEVSLRQAMHNLAVAAQTPLDPIFKLLNNDLPLSEGDAEDRDRLYGPITQAIMASHAQ